MPADVTLYDAAGINARTAANYDGLLERLFVAESVPAYSHHRLARLARGRSGTSLTPGWSAARCR